MEVQKRQPHFSFGLSKNQGSWVWHLSVSDGRGVVGVAPSADEAARDACASLCEIETGNGVIVMAPMLIETALTWNGVLEGFTRSSFSIGSG